MHLCGILITSVRLFIFQWNHSQNKLSAVFDVSFHQKHRRCNFFLRSLSTLNFFLNLALNLACLLLKFDVRFGPSSCNPPPRNWSPLGLYFDQMVKNPRGVSIWGVCKGEDGAGGGGEGRAVFFPHFCAFFAAFLCTSLLSPALGAPRRVDETSWEKI